MVPSRFDRPLSSSKSAERSELTDSSVSERLRSDQPSPPCFPLVRLSACSNSRLVLPCTLASLARVLSSSSMRSDDASSRASMWFAEPSANVKDLSRVLSLGGSDSPGAMRSVTVAIGSECCCNSSSTAALRLAMSP